MSWAKAWKRRSTTSLPKWRPRGAQRKLPSPERKLLPPPVRKQLAARHAAPAHKRILLKLSGEALMGSDAFGINHATIVRMVQEIAEVTRLGVQVAVVIGGGNIFRGVAGGAVGMDRATADYMGMLATVMNAL